jgi:hypothetical protein
VERSCRGCDQLPEAFHGKEGVSGSSPEEGSASRANGVALRMLDMNAVVLPASLRRRRRDQWSWAQLTAFFTSALILASSAAVNSVSAKEVGHMAPSSRFAASLKPNVAYLDLNFDAAVK